jgi:hypothetical protein
MAVQSVSINPVTAFSASAVLVGSASVMVGFSPLTAFGASAELNDSGGHAISFSPLSSFKACAKLTGGSDIDGMSLCDVLDVVLGMWSIFGRCSAPDFAKAEAVNIINASMQLVWNNAEGRSYWSSGELELEILEDATSVDIPTTVQNVTGPCRILATRQPLAPIGTIGELESFADLFLDGETPSTPVAYHIERMNQSGNDPAKMVLHVTPAPEEDTDFLLEVINECPRYTTEDLTSCPILPIPHQYTESLLLPIVRYQASTFNLFRQTAQKETIDREYQMARISLGLADPLPGKAGDNKEGVTK